MKRNLINFTAKSTAEV